MPRTTVSLTGAKCHGNSRGIFATTARARPPGPRSVLDRKMGRRAKLEPQQRQIVIEHLERGEPARTVAHELGVAPSTVYRCRARARQIANESGRAVRRQDT